MGTLWRKCLLRMTLFISYALVGAWIFVLIEKRDERNSETGDKMLAALKRKMETKLNTTINETDFDEFVTIASDALGIKGKKDWTWLNGCSFTMAAITTIGYGDITPQTAAGQGFVIPYCLVGLPIAMMALKTGGEVLHYGIKTTSIAFQKRILRHKNPQRTLTKCLTISTVNVFLFICIMAALGMYLDEWTFTESLYCWFVTFSTIGFGDYVPLGNFSKREGLSTSAIIITGVILTVPYITGMCLVSCLLNVLVEGSEYEFKNLKSQLRNCCKCKVGREDNQDSVDSSVSENACNTIRLENYSPT